MNVVVLFYRSPIPGLVKTRLAVGIGSVAAACVYRGLLHDLYRKLQDPKFHVAPYRADGNDGDENRPHAAAPWEGASDDPGRPVNRYSHRIVNETAISSQSVWTDLACNTAAT